MSTLGAGRGRLDPRRFSTEAQLLTAVTVWAFNFTVVKYALTHGFSPLAYSGPRFALAGLAFGALTARRERSLRIDRRDLVLLVGAALLGIWLNQLAFVYALHLTSAATVALLFGTGPVLVALIAHFSGSERLAARSWLGTAVCFAGVILVVAGGSGGGISGNLGGLLLGLATAATWAVYSVAVMPLMHRYSPYRLNATITLIGSLPLLATAAPQLAHEHWSQIGALAWIAFLYSLLLAYLFTNMIWFNAIHRVGASHAALFTNLEPFLGAIFAVLVLSEHLSGFQVAGGAVICAGILAARRQRLEVPPIE